MDKKQLEALGCVFNKPNIGILYFGNDNYIDIYLEYEEIYLNGCHNLPPMYCDLTEKLELHI